jgi:hypothetical protein
MRSVSYIQSVHLGIGNTNRGRRASIETVRRLDTDRGPSEHLTLHLVTAPFIYSRALITSAGRFRLGDLRRYIIRQYQNIAIKK